MFKRYYRENYKRIDVKNYNYKRKSHKYYVVTKGWNTGIFTDHSYALKQIKKYSGGYMKGFNSQAAAQQYWDRFQKEGKK